MKSSNKGKDFCVFALPGLFCFLAVVMVPFIYGIYLTLTDWNGVSSVKNFVGLSNFAAVMRDAQMCIRDSAYTDQAPYQYLKKGIGHLWFVHPETLSQLEFLLRMLSERGEDDTLYYIRYHFLKGDPVPRMHCPQECTVYEEAIRKKVSPSTH